MQEADRKTALERVREQELARMEQEKRLKEKMAALKSFDLEGL